MRKKIYVIYTEVIKDWDHEKNNELGFDPTKITHGSNKKVCWKCSICWHKWIASTNSRINRDGTIKNGCPGCGKIYVSETVLINEWDYEKNDKLGLDPTKITHGSNKKVCWKCSICGHKWLAAVCDRINPNDKTIKHGCPGCGGTAKSCNEEFIEKAIKIHGDKYDYSKVEYVNNKTKVEIICPEHGSFPQTPNDHLSGKGCQKCTNSISKISQEWLDSHNVPIECREVLLQLDNKKVRVDGYDKSTNTVYEFLGDFWHGNPKIFSAKEINPISKKSFGQLYEETVDRFNSILEVGYNIVYIWENNFDKKKSPIMLTPSNHPIISL